MAKASLIAKEILKDKAIKRFKTKRDSLRAILNSQTVSQVEKIRAQFKMQALPIRSCPTRKVNRCFVTGRARAVFRRFGLARQELREQALKGLIPGLKKASW